jgi:hypothetical protein
VKTIYVSIPSMMDTETHVTVENAFTSAEDPDRVYVGVSFLDKDDSEYKKVLSLKEKYKNISVEFNKLNSKNLSSFGTGDGRKRAASLYSEQDYMLQIDSHTLFLDGWDSYLIDLFNEFKQETGIDKFVLTAYLGEYEYDKDLGRNKISRLYYPFYVPEKFFLTNMPEWTTIDVYGMKPEKFIPCNKFNGNFAFGDKNFINNSGRVDDAVFYDEEVLQSINLIGNGFAMVYPNVDSFPLAHLYTQHINDLGGERTYFGDSLSLDDQGVIADRSNQNYVDYITNPNNKKAIEKYQKYARIDVKRGAFAHKYIPKKYLMEE